MLFVCLQSGGLSFERHPPGSSKVLAFLVTTEKCEKITKMFSMTAVHITFEIHYFNDFVFDFGFFESFNLLGRAIAIKLCFDCFDMDWLTSSGISYFYLKNTYTAGHNNKLLR